MTKCVLLLEDDADLARLVQELLEDAEYQCLHLTAVDDLVREAEARSPCVALVDSQNPTEFDLWWLGPRLSELGVPPVAFTAHVSARQQFEQDPHGYVGVIAKPFDAEEFLQVVGSICWDDARIEAS